ncbi:MAG: TnsD family Tn7-like transposition protein [Marinagarivorans sp.]
MLTIPMINCEPNESVYSLLCRVHQMASNASPLNTLKMVTGLRGYKPMSGLPTHISDIAKNLNLPKPPSVIINDHTHYPLYRLFIEHPKRAHIVNSMLGSGSVKSLLGLLRNHVGAFESLRYCKECLIDEIQSVGFAYWHREHLFPWVYFCPKHLIVLSVVDFKSEVYGDRALILPSGGEVIKLTEHSSNVDKLRNISRDTYYLLNVKNIDSIAINKDAYKILLHSCGICSGSGRINQNRLKTSVACWLKDLQSIPIFNRLYNSLNVGRSWAETIPADDYSFHHPLKHLIVLHSLGLTVDDLIASTSQQRQIDFNFSAKKKKMPDDASVKNAIESSGSIRGAAKLLNIDVTTLCCYANRLEIPYKHRTQYITRDIIDALLSDVKNGASSKFLSNKYCISIASVNRIKRTYLL